jgi:hypothetical protein
MHTLPSGVRRGEVMTYKEVKITLTEEFYKKYRSHKLDSHISVCATGCCIGILLGLGLYWNALPAFTTFRQIGIFIGLFSLTALMMFAAGITAGISIVGTQIKQQIEKEEKD